MQATRSSQTATQVRQRHLIAAAVILALLLGFVATLRYVPPEEPLHPDTVINGP